MVALDVGMEDSSVVDRKRVCQAEGTAKAKAKRQEGGSLFYMPVAEDDLESQGKLSSPVPGPEFTVRGIKREQSFVARGWPQTFHQLS